VSEQANKVNAYIKERVRERGLPDSFAPSFGTYWMNRGENMFKERRAELRRVAKAKLEANAEAAKAEIDRKEAALLVELLTHGIYSNAAKDFLSQLPTAEQLMPQLQISDVENRVKMLNPYNFEIDED
jgi:hypothetical protein